jgi:hypothetical protein
MRPPQELLYDSEASLRLVDHAIEELSATGTEIDSDAQTVLRHVSSATETTTTDILDGLSRAVVLVEQLDSASALSDAQRHQMASSLREELSGLANRLQFQDVDR